VTTHERDLFIDHQDFSLDWRSINWSWKYWW